MRRRGCLVRQLLVVGLAFVALPVGSALADATIGQADGQFNPNFSADCSGVLADTNSNYTVPAGGGTIDSFSIQMGTGLAGTQAGFLVLRPVGGDNYEVVSLGPVVTLAGTGTQSFLADVPVQGGEILGLWLVPATSNPNFCVRFANPGGVVLSQDPSAVPSVDQTLAFDAAGLRLDLNESAHLRSVGSPPAPTSKDQCKNTGWRNLTQFKNQGDCTSFVASGGKNPPGGP
jgi:hypothetical protein